MTETPILRAGQRRVLILDGATYTLRALTFGEYSDLSVANLDRPNPSEAVIQDAVRYWCETNGRDGLASDLDAYDEARDAFATLFATQPSEADPAGRAEWLRERGADIEAAQRRLISTERAREVAYHLAREEVAKLRRQANEFTRADAVAALSLALIEPPAPVEDLPAGHVARLTQELRAMNQPTVSAAKN